MSDRSDWPTWVSTFERKAQLQGVGVERHSIRLSTLLSALFSRNRLESYDMSCSRDDLPTFTFPKLWSEGNDGLE